MPRPLDPPEALEPRRLLDGQFSTTPAWTAPAPGASVVAADFDRDGLPDLATASGHAVSFLRGRGDGTFETARTTTLNVRADRLLAAAPTGNAPSDLFAVGGAGRMHSKWEGPKPRAVWVRTLRVNPQTLAFEVVGLWAQHAKPHGPLVDARQAVVGDFNADGIADLAIETASPSTPTLPAGPGRISVLTSAPDGSLARTRVIAPRNLQGLSTAIDVNADGRTDLVGGASPSALLAGAAGLGATFLDLERSPTGDLNGDHIADALWEVHAPHVPGTAGTVEILAAYGRGDGTFEAPVRVGSATTSETIIDSGTAIGAVVISSASLRVLRLNADAAPDVLWWRTRSSSSRGGVVFDATSWTFLAGPALAFDTAQALPEAFNQRVPPTTALESPTFLDANLDGLTDFAEVRAGVLRVHLQLA